MSLQSGMILARAARQCTFSNSTLLIKFSAGSEGHRCTQYYGYHNNRFFSNTPIPDSNEHEKEESESPLLYEGAFAGATLRLKRVSITTCFLGLVGFPLLSLVYGGGDIPATGQLAVGSTAIFAATGSTAALSYCMTPYVHKLEKVFGDDTTATETNKNDEADGGEEKTKPTLLIKATTRNILAQTVETVFDPENDVTQNTGSRPFCNFVAKGLPMYIHPELVDNEKLRDQLVPPAKPVELTDEQKKKEADDFL